MRAADVHGSPRRPPIAAPARIIRDGREARHLPRLLESAQALEDGFGGAQGEGLRRFGALREALGRSPFWRERLAQVGLAARELRGVADLQHLPTLDRQSLGERWEDLPDLGGDCARDLCVVRSSGSTGEPVKVVRDGYDNVHMWAALRFFLKRLGLGLPPRPRVVLLDSLPGGLEYSVRLPLLERGALHRISLMRPDAAARLRRAAPFALFTDPAGLHELVELLPVPGPEVIFTSAQQLSAELRRRVGRATAAPVIDYYALTEVGPIAWSCLRDPSCFHALAPDVWLEEVDGELVVTRLRPSVLPVVRYRTGDTGRLFHHRCECGFRGTSIRELRGRHACELVTPAGRGVDAWQLAWIFKHHPLSQFRLTQRRLADFLLEAPEPVPLALCQQLTAALGQLGWASPALEVQQRELPRQAKAQPFNRTFPAAPRR